MDDSKTLSQTEKTSSAIIGKYPSARPPRQQIDSEAHKTVTYKTYFLSLSSISQDS